MSSREALRAFEDALRAGRYVEADALRERLVTDLAELDAWKAMMTTVFTGDYPSDAPKTPPEGPSEGENDPLKGEIL